MSKHKFSLTSNVLVAVIVVLCACSNAADQGENAGQEQKVPRYRVHPYEDRLDCPLYYTVEGECYFATTQARDAESLARITEIIYEAGSVPAIQVSFTHPENSYTFAMAYYFRDKDYVNDVLYKKDVSRATIKGRAYIFRYIVEAKPV